MLNDPTNFDDWNIYIMSAKKSPKKPTKEAASTEVKKIILKKILMLKKILLKKILTLKKILLKKAPKPRKIPKQQKTKHLQSQHLNLLLVIFQVFPHQPIDLAGNKYLGIRKRLKITLMITKKIFKNFQLKIVVLT